jgi:hypothetical protein
MALSDKVEDKLKEAEGVLRDAIYWAAKNENPVVISSISKIICEIDMLMKIDRFQDKLEELMKKQNGNDSGFLGGFF